ncbi:MAG TPA: 2-phospho-L-lactate transferase [Actinomycetes bacterium]|nr:2-phospho-L-lactate transferase [Actinomycetes bacterium]
MNITALAGGIGGARFLVGLLHHLSVRRDKYAGAKVTVVGNTADDITLYGLRVCPDLDTVMYTLGGGIHDEQGWGRAHETFTVREEFAAYEVAPDWFTLGDRDIATHIVRTQMLRSGWSLTDVTAALCARWEPGVTLLPMSNEPVETHVVINDPDSAESSDGKRAIHFQEWWVRLQASVPAQEFVFLGADQAKPAPGVLEAISDCDAVLLPPSNPVVSIGAILQVPGVADAIRTTAAPVVGVSPIISGAPVRGMADACLRAIGVQTNAQSVAAHYGARLAGGLLDGWLVDEQDASLAASPGMVTRARPLLMIDTETSAAIAGAALDLAVEIKA